MSRRACRGVTLCERGVPLDERGVVGGEAFPRVVLPSRGLRGEPMGEELGDTRLARSLRALSVPHAAEPLNDGACL